MNIDKEKLSPMMRKYLDTKEEYSDCILFYRLGDFYEMFFDDALLASKILNITLTGKACGLEDKAPMCGVPFHSAESYIQELVEAGYKVAIGEQVEDPSQAKGLVKREVVRIVTPGTIIEDDGGEVSKNNYLLSIFVDENNSSISYVDINTGELNSTVLDKSRLKDEICKISPKEILCNDMDVIEDISNICEMANIFLNKEFKSQWLDTDVLFRVFGSKYIEDTKVSDYIGMKESISICLNYIHSTQMLESTNINRINIYSIDDYMTLDLFTRTNLELTKTMRGGKKKGSLLHVLDSTQTPMGARMLRRFIEQPLKNKEKIDYRLDITSDIKENFILRDELKTRLSNIFDLERICAKVAYEKASPRDLVNLKNSITMLPQLVNTIQENGGEILKSFIMSLDVLQDLYSVIDEAILDEPNNSLKDGNIIKSEYNDELRELRDISQNGTSLIKDLEMREKEKTNAKTLKIGYNKVFGYYIEITKAALLQADIDERYIRKQTLVNAERFITPELKEIEDKIINAEDRIKVIEYEIFKKIRDYVYENIERIQRVANLIGELDVYVSNAIVANKNNYVRPLINENDLLDIRDGRHPVIEKIIGSENFISNDTKIDCDNMINIITGPNMSGKSTYMRQNALISLMAHIGTFVPASYANIPIMDRIFTRVGASDDLSQGQSTFMIEMDEVSHILRYATDKSLIILDEVGRGTSTYDGISLAWSIVEYIQENIGAKTLFATHYHELTELEDKYSNIRNYSVAVNEDNNDVVFLRKIIDKPADKSYGIYVAQLAKLPQKVLDRAGDILKELENNHIRNTKGINNSYTEKEKINSTYDDIKHDNSINTTKDNTYFEKENDKNFVDNIKGDVSLESTKSDELPKKSNDEESNNRAKDVENVNQISFDDVLNDGIYREFILEVMNVDMMNSTPIDIMNKMYELQKKAKSIL